MKWQYNDGRRLYAGFKGTTGDCVVRAIAIATNKPYKEVYDTINKIAKDERITKRGIKSNSRTGVSRKTCNTYLEGLGWRWTATMHIGQGCKVHLRNNELPSGKLIVRLSKHLTAVVNGVIQDTFDCSRKGTRCVYGYWAKIGGMK